MRGFRASDQIGGKMDDVPCPASPVVRQMRVVRRVMVGIALACGLSAVACSGSGDADGRVTLRFWAMGAEGEVVQQLVRDFERENPRIHVQVQQIPWSAAHEKLLTAHVG
ncbi:MAG TPA: hypothetical protein VFE05_18885, partial [Longimicrobiaceae bacterium]|nr:hypothetical protein [Longimicrobiaceae bacterium]